MKQNQYVFYVLAFLQGLVFYSAIATLYRQNKGISLTEMGLIESVFSFTVIVLEIPLGYLCDKIGYKKMMLLSNFIFFISKAVFYKAENFYMFLLERILLAFASSGLSGCDISLLYQSIEKEKAGKVFGIYQMMGALGMVIASFSFTLWMKDDFEFAARMTMYAYLFAFLLTYGLADGVCETHTMTMQNVYKYLKQQKKIIPLLAGSVLLKESIHTIVIFYSQLQYQRVGIPLKWYGILFLFIQLCTLCSGVNGYIIQKVKANHFAVFVYGCTTLLCFLLIKVESAGLSILILAVLSMMESFYLPLLNLFQNESIHFELRATMLSFYSMGMNVVGMPVLYLLGRSADDSLTNAYLLGGCFCLAGMVLFIIWNKKQNI